VNANASWPDRYGHTTVIDAAGNIYLMGGLKAGPGDGYFNDVWVGTNKGANRTQGYSAGTQEVLTGYTGYTGGTQESLKAAQGVLKEASRGTQGALEGLHPQGVLKG
jgi:hypothetical protein